MTLGLARSNACGPLRASPAQPPPPQPRGSAEEELLPDVLAQVGGGSGVVSAAPSVFALTACPLSGQLLPWRPLRL